MREPSTFETSTCSSSRDTVTFVTALRACVDSRIVRSVVSTTSSTDQDCSRSWGEGRSFPVGVTDQDTRAADLWIDFPWRSNSDVKSSFDSSPTSSTTERDERPIAFRSDEALSLIVRRSPGRRVRVPASAPTTVSASSETSRKRSSTRSAGTCVDSDHGAPNEASSRSSTENASR